MVFIVKSSLVKDDTENWRVSQNQTVISYQLSVPKLLQAFGSEIPHKYKWWVSVGVKSRK
jgi:hypothetical protein